MDADLTCEMCQGRRQVLSCGQHVPCPGCQGGGRRRPTLAEWDALVAKVAYPAHESSDEGTCWCPVAEQAAWERDEMRAERDRYIGVLAKIEYEGHSEGCNRHSRVTHQWAQRPGCCCHMRDVRAALDAKEGT